MPTDLYLKQLELGPMQNFVYLIGDAATREAAVVDPGWDAPAILRAAAQDGVRLTKVFVTHHHFDHVGGLPELLRTLDIPVYVHRDDAPLVKIAPSSLRAVSGGETVEVGRVPVALIHTPGHTPGSQCLLIDGRLLTGDTLFIKACGRWDLPGGDPSQLYDSLNVKLKALDEATVVYPGHNYAERPTSTIGDEKHTNPFMQAPSREAFLQAIGRG
jgi:glyoxylase-like metal-dependent hydrolase (beta-lactamase superfamily II)